ncbi:hypothetical protein NDU88_004869 [Pleurodeles waltl]|uniref:Uncharacterized protein n=1 Tax=Pleurodeles waltl TaxID=8319 RepID=A0AAV7PDQ5_PLEWA|nr:hypothetical protein NDU88_004869 [Pleurodeles waltl]
MSPSLAPRVPTPGGPGLSPRAGCPDVPPYRSPQDSPWAPLPQVRSSQRLAGRKVPGKWGQQGAGALLGCPQCPAPWKRLRGVQEMPCSPRKRTWVPRVPWFSSPGKAARTARLFTALQGRSSDGESQTGR